jgi:hypothetical protein
LFEIESDIGPRRRFALSGRVRAARLASEARKSEPEQDRRLRAAAARAAHPAGAAFSQRPEVSDGSQAVYMEKQSMDRTQAFERFFLA